MSGDTTPLAGAVKTLRLLADGQVDVVLSFEPKDRVAVMQMMGSPGQPIACVPLKQGFAAVSPAPASSAFRDLGPICREAIVLCDSPKFQEYISRAGLSNKWKPTADAAKGFILAQCNVDSRKELDTAEGARELFISHVRKPFHAWLDKQGQKP